MKLHTVGRHLLAEGDCVEVLRAMPDNCFDACVSDPPYGLGFMGKAWDCDVPGPAFAAELFRTLKPGAHACLFGGTRTFHRLAVALEDAGFEIRDCLSWLYGTGFPKSLDVSKAIDAAAGATRTAKRCPFCAGSGFAIDVQTGEGPPCPACGGSGTETVTRPKFSKGRGHGREDDGSVTYRGVNGGHEGEVDLPVTAPATPEAAQWEGWGTALKPSWEPVLLVRKPLIGTVAANVLAHGTGGLNIDACRIAGESTKRTNTAKIGYGGGGNTSTPYETGSNVGRWPANVVLDEVAAEQLDAQSGEKGGGKGTRGGTPNGAIYNGSFPRGDGRGVGYADTGGASRFFYTAKPSRAERDRGCEALPVRSGGEATDRKDGAPGTIHGRAGAGGKGGARNIHPTVKPAALIRWLVQLVTPPGGTVLDPFAGSGTIFLACEGLDVEVNAIERDPEYCTIAIARGSACK